jgi:heme a synthase
VVRSENNPWLHRFALLTALATLGLIGMGGLVTSHNAGLSVPDWPTSYGYNMFLFPVSKWVGGIFYEHTHRLWASGVGLLTTVLMVWLWCREPRAWLRRLGVIAFLAVVVQGVLGGLRVTLLEHQLGIVHAVLGQLFLVLVSAIALFTSPWWRRLPAAGEAAPDRHGLRFVAVGVVCLVLIQLGLGATMRQQHNGLSIPDFPLAYGKLWPPVDAASVAAINQHRIAPDDYGPITAFQILLQMLHRVGALLIASAAAVLAWRLRRGFGPRAAAARLATLGFGLVIVQCLLGAATIWSNKAADVATAHVLVGALVLVTESLLAVVMFRCAERARATARARVSTPEMPSRLIPASSGEGVG